MPQRPPLGFRVASAPDENPSPCGKCDKNSKFGSHPGRSPGPRELPELLRRFPFPRSPRAPAPARRAPPPGPPQVPAGGRLPPREQRPRDRSAHLGPSRLSSARLGSLRFTSARPGSARAAAPPPQVRAAAPLRGLLPRRRGCFPSKVAGKGLAVLLASCLHRDPQTPPALLAPRDGKQEVPGG